MVEYVHKFKSDPTILKSRIKPTSIVDKPDSKADEQPFMDTFLTSLSSFFSSEEEAKRALSPKEENSKSGEIDIYDAYESAMENRRMREAAGITQSLGVDDIATLENTAPSLSTQSSGLMSYTKDEEVSAPMTAEAKEIVKTEIGIPPSMWDAYREEISAIESGGKENPYAAKGGANKHYDGMYQLGKVAKQDAGQLLGITLGHTTQEREAYRNNPELQEKAFAAYTAKNHNYLLGKSEKYKALPLKEKLAVLGYAHNQGWSGADSWLETGDTGKDAFGTKGTKYYDAIIDRLNP